ncbi:AAA family ATPase, partial [Klebsiella pneumoniae]
MEDIDATLEIYNESTVINLLDGVDRVDKIVFLATTNYPEKLGTRIMNRPSRFDKRFKVGYPTDNTRKIYLEHLIQDED